MKYKVILFDADETLFDFKKTEDEAFRNTLLEYGIEYDEEYHFGAYKEVNTAIWKELEEGLITLSELKIERFRRFLNKLNMDFDAHEFAGVYIKHLANGSFLLDGAEEFIKSISDDYILAVVTNGITDVQEKRVGKSIIADYFKEIIISEKVGVSKPDPVIFKHTMELIGDFKKEEILMVGDNLNSDIKGGINYGIDTCWFNPIKKENKSDMVPTHEVHGYEELKSILS